MMKKNIQLDINLLKRNQQTFSQQDTINQLRNQIRELMQFIAESDQDGAADPSYWQEIRDWWDDT